MQISEYIAKLQAIQDEHGDIPLIEFDQEYFTFFSEAITDPYTLTNVCVVGVRDQIPLAAVIGDYCHKRCQPA